MVAIREAAGHDRDAVWEIFHAVVATGDTYVFEPETPREEALAYWFGPSTRTYVAEVEGRVVGTYILRPNRPGLGSHVSNAAFMVSPSARGLGTGRAMGEHCLDEARRLGYRAMQFNFVVSTNEVAVKLWERLGLPSSASSPAPSAIGPVVSSMPTSCSGHSYEPRLSSLV
jgi:GNAT superfamily N-acetyltransferase